MADNIVHIGKTAAPERKMPEEKDPFEVPNKNIEIQNLKSQVEKLLTQKREMSALLEQYVPQFLLQFDKAKSSIYDIDSLVGEKDDEHCDGKTAFFAGQVKGCADTVETDIRTLKQTFEILTTNIRKIISQ